VSLHDYIQNKVKPSSEAVACIFSRQIAEGIHYLHSKQIRHGCLTSQNILMKDDRNIKLSDYAVDFYSISNISKDETDCQNFCYMAPEMFGSTEIGFPVDIWALGCVTMELTTKKIPFESVKTFAELEAMVCVKKLSPLQTLKEKTSMSPQAECFLSKTFVLDPDERPTIETMLLDYFIPDLKEFENKGTGFSEGTESNFMFDVIFTNGENVHSGENVNQMNSNSLTPLMFACEKRCPHIVQLLLESGAEVDKKNDRNGETCLMAASKAQCIEIVELLLQFGAEVNQKDNVGKTPLNIACKNGHTDIVKLLIKAHAEVNEKDIDGETPLIIACRNNSLEILQLLLESTAKVDKCNRNGDTALMIATQNGCTNTVRELIKANADVNKKNKNGETALIIAIRNEHSNITEMLLSAEADITYVQKNIRTPLMIAAEEGQTTIVEQIIKNKKTVNVDEEDHENMTPLLIASKMGHTAVVRLLLKENADVTKRNALGETSLMIATRNGHTEIVHLLLEGDKGEVNATNKKNETSLMIASRKGYLDIVQLLLQAKADVDFVGKNDLTSLMIAAKSGKTEIVKLLLKSNDQKVEIDQKDNNGETSLLMACKMGHLDVIDLLINANADVNKINQEEETALFIAIKKRRTDILRLLLNEKATANVNYSSRKKGLTALMIASQLGCSSIVNILIDKGADVDKKDMHHKDSLLMAVEEGRTETVRILIEKSNTKDIERLKMMAEKKGHRDIVKIIDTYEENADEWDTKATMKK
ncbi:ankyrin repeat and KH domain-containing protein mask, partial [Biomphalaria glabrata]